MSCPSDSPRDSFAQRLRGKLAKLEQELLDAHLQICQALDSPSSDHLRFEKVPLILQSSPQEGVICGNARDFVTKLSSKNVEAHIERERQSEACASVHHSPRYGTPDVLRHPPKVKVNFSCVEPISAKEQDETPYWPESGNKAPAAPQKSSVISSLDSQMMMTNVDGDKFSAKDDFQGFQPPHPVRNWNKKKQLSFAHDAPTSEGLGSFASKIFKTRSGDKGLKKTPRFPNKPSSSLQSQDQRVSYDQVKLEISDAHRVSSSQTSLAPTLYGDSATELLGYIDRGCLELKLRPQWQKSEAKVSKAKNQRFAMMVNQMLLGQQAPKKSEVRESTRSAISYLYEGEGWGAGCDCIIDPFSKKWLTWELFGITILLYDVVLIPMQGFDMPASAFLEAMDWLTMSYWTLTFLLTFSVSFQRDSEAAFVRDRRRIIIHYIKGWFFFDLLVVGSDWASVVIEIIVDSSGSSLKSARVARLARLGRLFRILRLLRLMRLGEMLQKVERVINSEYLSICFIIIGNVVAIFALAHITACIWFVIGDAHDHMSWLHVYELKDAEVGKQYMQSLGWSLSTLLGAQITEVFPVAVAEFMCALFILLLGTITVSLVFSSTTAAMTRLQQLRAEDRDATFMLKKYLRQNNISGNLEARILRYCDIARSVHAKRIDSDKVKLLDILSGPLRLSLQVELHAPHLTCHPFFRLYYKTNAGAMGELCLTAVSTIYLSRSDVLFQTFATATNMFFLVSGVMVYRRAKGAKSPRRTMKIEKHTNCSEAALWSCWIHRGSMISLIESQILALDVVAFCQITEAHHDVFFEACGYAGKYVLRANDLLEDKKFVWDVPFELMYGEEDQRGSLRFSLANKGPGFMSILAEAEDMAAELMDAQSESDSDDERLFKAAMKRSQQDGRAIVSFKRGSTL